MITELSAQNFKSWENTGELRFAPLTAFFGANSSGKTSILQVLLMLKQTVEHPSPDWNEPLYFGNETSLVNLENFDETIHRHNPFSTLCISLSWISPQPADFFNKYGRDTLTYSLEVRDKDVQHFNYKGNGHRFGIRLDGGNYEASTPEGEEPVQSLFRSYGVRGTSTDTFLIFSELEKDFEKLFSQVRYLGPLREYPRHQYTWDGDHPNSVGKHGEEAVSAMLSGRVQLLSVDKQILKWLQRLDLIDSYRLQPDFSKKGGYDFYVSKHGGEPEVRLKDVGFGVSQVLPVLILCYYVPEGSILILEQPEAHLHPKAQSELADVLIDVVKNRNIQIILESHSEHLLHRLTRRIAEEQLATTDTALYSCQINESVSEIESLEMDEYGNISNWPQNFFGDEMGDLAAKAKAEIERRKANKQ